MTEEDSADREARLAALLSVDVGDVPREATRAGDRASSGPPEPATPAAADPPPSREPVADAGGRSRGWRPVLSFAVLAVLLAAGTGLAYTGTRIVRSSTEGKVLEPIDDPKAPGFEAIVDPTPTLVVLHQIDGSLDAVSLLTLPDPGGGGGGVLLVPARTVSEIGVFGVTPLQTAYDLGNEDVAAQAIGEVIGSAPGETVVVDARRLADLTAPVAPIAIDNPNELVVDGEVRFEEGAIELAADDVGPYLEATVEGESDLARLFRYETFWQAWLDAVAANGTPEAVPGELDSGVGRFVRTIAAGTAIIDTLPVQPATEGRFGDEAAFVPRSDEIRDLVDRLVPFPVSPTPGARARLRLLNGTTDTSKATEIAADLPPAGVQVVIVGNATALSEVRTTVRYAGREFRDEAEAVVEILGVGEAVEDDRPSDVADITVTLGADYG